MMETYARVYGKYAELEYRMADVQWPCCPECGKETLEFLRSTDTHEIVGCTECMVTDPTWDDKHIVSTDEGEALKCAHCSRLCDTLYAYKRSRGWIIGCENCLGWVDSFEEEA